MNSTLDRNPVILIHGIWDTKAIFSKMSARLTQLGWCVHSLNLTPNDGSLSLDSLAKQLADYISQNFEPQQTLDIVGYSMGGIVSRYYVQRLGGINLVQRFITISAPHSGTLTAYCRSLPGYLDMRLNSDLLRDLNQDVMDLRRINFTSIWTPFDMMIVPSKSSKMPVGKEVKLNVMLHRQMVTDDQSINALIEELKAPIKNQISLKNE
ncbi:triacylglycerol lipase [Tychonema sp. LEGE 07199]|uniref:esterase/lipase family protein n=1 Tax=unclassified Tychonema TaxID=2642144 RepID=UPI001882AAB6|nr:MULTISPECIES: triacylglycerol lipase [unclassified Tychonema]MBE9122973.1 triacylglycerol lipase [Tychonema sp. LEGE 07199]MBE9134691.1 triacylglycerol lipase [Tychonema sp. LEGE 07196]